MTANLFGERFLGVREPAWHKLGKVVDLGTDPVDGLSLIDGDFEIVIAPLVTEVPTLFGTSRVEIPDRFAIIRQPTEDDLEYAVYGICGPNYEIIQRKSLAEALRKLTELWPLETIGLLGKGETIFFALDAGEIEVGKDLLHQYFTIVDTVDGKTSVRVAFTPVRFVCQNTLDAGMRAAVTNSALVHRTGVTSEVEFKIDIVQAMLKTQDSIIAKLDQMTKAKIKADQVNAIFAAAYPFPPSPKVVDLAGFDENEPWLQQLTDNNAKSQAHFAYVRDRAQTRRNAVAELFGKFNDQFPDTANTPWAAWNAVCELADWRDGNGDADYAALFGGRAKEKHMAYAVASTMTKK